jgi:phenylacetic acid degradation protein/carnitine operon protein CaiE
MFPGVTVVLKENAHIGHGAIVHGALIGMDCLVGMNAVVMDDVQLGDGCIVGALSFIKAGEQIPPRSLIAGNPAKVIKEVSDDMLAWKKEGTKIYQHLVKDMQNNFSLCKPLRKAKNYDARPGSIYETWKRKKDS